LDKDKFNELSVEYYLRKVEIAFQFFFTIGLMFFALSQLFNIENPIKSTFVISIGSIIFIFLVFYALFYSLPKLKKAEEHYSSIKLEYMKNEYGKITRKQK